VLVLKAMSVALNDLIIRSVLETSEFAFGVFENWPIELIICIALFYFRELKYQTWERFERSERILEENTASTKGEY